ncbi:MAG: hypothetical protein WAQ28_10765 [Bacteroidia bacterium]|jgi:poly(3-hydroxybutyrate) depolymerase
MWFRTLVLVLVGIVVFLSCSNNSTEHSADGESVIHEADNFEKGKVLTRTVCKADTTQSYALYLPANYSSKEKYPVIYAFDPHASGLEPVSRYERLAEKYNYIIVGSNNSKNGTSWEESQMIAGKLFADVSTRLSIDLQRVYLIGFSGGARVANTLTIFNGGINSVICCGAASPVATITNPRNNYCYLGIAGNEDFNYIEMKRYDMVGLAGHNVKHSLITFNGKHEWPDQSIMDEGFWWFELNEMRKDSSKKDSKRIEEHTSPLMKELETYYTNKNTIEAYFLSRKIINFYDGLIDLTRCYEILKTVQNSKEVDAFLNAEQQAWKDEERLKQEYVNAIQTKDLKWWKQDIAALNQKIKTGKDKEKVLVYKRVRSFLSLVAYMQTSNALNQRVYDAAEHFSEVYVLVDPDNSESHYLKASVAAIKGDVKEANVSLQKAINSGFTDGARLQGDAVFNTFKNTAEFNELLKKIPAK